MRIGIVTDSTADLPAELVRQYNIEVIPLHVQLDGREYKDGVELTTSIFYELLRSSDGTPSTSQPAPGVFVEVYRKMLKEYDAVISIHLTHALSGTVQTARIARDSMNGAPVYVVDSQTISMGMGALVIQAARDAVRGLGIAEIVGRIEKKRSQVRLFVALETLEYLRRGGRIGKMAAFLGTLLKIRPLLQVINGAIDPLGKCRSRKEAIQTLLDHAFDVIRPENHYIITILHAEAEQDALDMQKVLKTRFPLCEYYLGEVGPAIGCHVGPEALGIAVTPMG